MDVVRVCGGHFVDRIDDDELFALLRRFGRNTNAFLLTYGGYRWFRSVQPVGLIGYVPRGRTLVVAGDPLCDPGDAPAVLAAFARAAGPRRRIALVLASAWLLPTLRGLGYGAIRVGADPYFALADWAPRGDRAKGLRHPVNRARRASIAVMPYRAGTGRDERLEEALRGCAAAWLASRRALPLHFLVDCRPLSHATERRYFLAWDGTRLVGFLACAPIYARSGWYLEDVVRQPGAPYGVAELLITSALAALRAEGATVATLGVAPLAMPGQDDRGPGRRLGDRLFRLAAAPFYSVRGLERFKRKFVPSWWEPVYLAYRPGHLTPGLLLDVLGAFPPGGLSALIRARFMGLLERVGGAGSPRRPTRPGCRPGDSAGSSTATPGREASLDN